MTNTPQTIGHIHQEAQSPETLQNISLNLVDAEGYIDTYAEQRALEEFDKEMEIKKGTGSIGKITGFFKRSIFRVGRGAYIEAQKRAIKQDIYNQLQSNSESEVIKEISEYLNSAHDAIVDENFIDGEEVGSSLDQDILNFIKNEIIDEKGSLDEDDRLDKMNSLYDHLIKQYDKKIAMSQLEKAIQVIEKQIVGVDMETIQLNVKFFDIGRIGNERSGSDNESRVGAVTRMLDWADTQAGKSVVMSKVSGVMRHPVFAATASAFAIKGMTSASNLLTLGGGLIVGSGLAAGRGTRERRDHQVTAQRARITGSSFSINDTFQEELDNINKSLDIIDIQDIIKYLESDNKDNDSKKEIALDYLARRKATQQTGRNYIVYGDTNATALNARTLLLIKNLDRDNTKWYEGESEINTINNSLSKLKKNHEQVARMERKIYRKYGLKQGAWFAGVGALVGGVTAGVSSLLSDVGNSVEGESVQVPNVSQASAPVGDVGDNTVSHDALDVLLDESTEGEELIMVFPNDIMEKEFTRDINRIWLDNDTLPFDGNELRIWKAGDNFSITAMLDQFSGHDGIKDVITSTDCKEGNAFALLTVGNSVFELSIDENGIIETPESLKDIMNNETFKYLEVVKSADSGHRVFATVAGSNTGTIDLVSEISAPTSTEVTHSVPAPTIEPDQPFQAVAPVSEPVNSSSSAGGFVLPIGVTPYHEGSKKVETNQLNDEQPEEIVPPGVLQKGEKDSPITESENNLSDSTETFNENIKKLLFGESIQYSSLDDEDRKIADGYIHNYNQLIAGGFQEEIGSISDQIRSAYDNLKRTHEVTLEKDWSKEDAWIYRSIIDYSYSGREQHSTFGEMPNPTLFAPGTEKNFQEMINNIVRARVGADIFLSESDSDMIEINTERNYNQGNNILPRQIDTEPTMMQQASKKLSENIEKGKNWASGVLSEFRNQMDSKADGNSDKDKGGFFRRSTAFVAVGVAGLFARVSNASNPPTSDSSSENLSSGSKSQESSISGRFQRWFDGAKKWINSVTSSGVDIAESKDKKNDTLFDRISQSFKESFAPMVESGSSSRVRANRIEPSGIVPLSERGGDIQDIEPIFDISTQEDISLGESMNPSDSETPKNIQNIEIISRLKTDSGIVTTYSDDIQIAEYQGGYISIYIPNDQLLFMIDKPASIVTVITDRYKESVKTSYYTLSDYNAIMKHVGEKTILFEGKDLLKKYLTISSTKEETLDTLDDIKIQSLSEQTSEPKKDTSSGIEPTKQYWNPY